MMSIHVGELKVNSIFPMRSATIPHLPRYYQKSAEAYLDKALNSFLICPHVFEKSFKRRFLRHVKIRLKLDSEILDPVVEFFCKIPLEIVN